MNRPSVNGKSTMKMSSLYKTNSQKENL